MKRCSSLLNCVIRNRAEKFPLYYVKTVSKFLHRVVSKACRNFCTVLCHNRVAIFSPCYIEIMFSENRFLRGLHVQLYLCLNKRQHLFCQNHFHIFDNYKSTIKFEIRYFREFSSSSAENKVYLGRDQPLKLLHFYCLCLS